MLTRLNGWERIGLVITVIWLAYVLLLGAIGITGQEPFGTIVKGEESTAFTPAQCSAPWPEKKTGEFSFEEATGACPPGATELSPAKQIVTSTPDVKRFFLWRFLLAAVVPPLLLWLLSYISTRTVKWIVAGFKRQAT